MNQKVTELNLNILKIAVDPHRADVVLSKLREDFGKDYAIATSKDYKKAITPLAYNTKSKLKSKEIYFNSKLTRLHLAGTMAKVDNNEFINLVKMHSYGRIDASMSLLYARKAKELYLIEI